MKQILGNCLAFVEKRRIDIRHIKHMSFQCVSSYFKEAVPGWKTSYLSLQTTFGRKYLRHIRRRTLKNYTCFISLCNERRNKRNRSNKESTIWKTDMYVSEGIWGTSGTKHVFLDIWGSKQSFYIIYYLGTSDTKKGSALLKKGTEATRARQLKWITSCKVRIIISVGVLLLLVLLLTIIIFIIIMIIVVHVFKEYQVLLRNSPLVTFLIIRQGLPLRQKTFPAGTF